MLAAPASMKCCPRRNCDASRIRRPRSSPRLNEVQFPKELRLGRDHVLRLALHASMKCSSRRNCDARACGGQDSLITGLNEVQFPKELRRPAQYSPPPRTSEETSRALRARTPAQPPHPSPHLTDSAPFQRSTAASTARGSSSTGALASGDKRPLWRDRPGQADIGESLFIN